MVAARRSRPQMASLENGTLAHVDDGVICEGSDAEDSPMMKVERQKRREAIALRYLQGHAPFIMSAQLRGPFNKESRWINPWRSKRTIQKQPTKRRAVTEHNIPAHNVAAAGLGKRRRNDSNSSSSIGMRAEALTECSNTSVDIVGNRQPERPDLYSGFNRSAPAGLHGPRDSTNLDERENIQQIEKTGAKRKADTKWLKRADIGKRPRNDWVDPMSPTPKDRQRVVIGDDKIILDATDIPREKTKKQMGQLQTEKAKLPPLTAASVVKSNPVQSVSSEGRWHAAAGFQPTSRSTEKKSEQKTKERSKGPQPGSTSSSMDRKRLLKNGKLHAASSFNKHSENEDEADQTIKIGRSAREYECSPNGSSFAIPSSSFACKPVQQRLSAPTFEPSPVRTFSRDQLDPEILHGLSQASRLALAAQQLTPLSLDDSTLNIVERRSSHIIKENLPSLPRGRNLSKETPSTLETYTLGSTSYSRSSQMKAAAVGKTKSKRCSRDLREGSPLPPDSFKYRKVRHKIPPLVGDEQDGGKGIANKTNNKTVKVDSTLLIEKQDHTCSKDILSLGRQSPNKIVSAEPRFPISDSAQKMLHNLPTTMATRNEDAENLSSHPLDGKLDDEISMRTSTRPIRVATNEMEVDEPEKYDEDPRVTFDGRDNEDNLDVLIVPSQEQGEREVQCKQQALESQPSSREVTTEELRCRDTEHGESRPPCEAPNCINTEEPELDHVTLSQDLSSHSKLSSPTPCVAQDDQTSNTGVISAVDDAISQSAPQTPWTIEELVPPSQHLPARSASASHQISMSQSKNAAALLLNTELHCSTDSLKYDESSQSDKIHLSEPMSPGVSPTTPAPNTKTLSQDQLSSRKSLISQLARVGNLAFLSLSNPWAKNTQSPIKSPLSTKTKKRVSFTPLPPSSDSETPARKLHDHVSQQSNGFHEPKDLSSPPQPHGPEPLLEGDDKICHLTKETKSILTRSTLKNGTKSGLIDGTNLASSPGIGAMAEAFLAADAGIPPSDVKTGNVIDGSWNFGNLIEEETHHGETDDIEALPLPIMPESQLVNPWGEEDEAPPFLIADCDTGLEEDNGLVEDILSDMDAMLGDWDVDVELERASKYVKGETERKTTARERLIGVRD